MTGGQRKPGDHTPGVSSSHRWPPTIRSADSGTSTTEAPKAAPNAQTRRRRTPRSALPRVRSTIRSKNSRPAKTSRPRYCRTVRNDTAVSVAAGVPSSSARSGAPLVGVPAPIWKEMAPPMGCPSAETIR